MAAGQLAFDILARDRASKVFDQVSARADKTNANFQKVGTGMGGVFGKLTTAVGGLALGWQAWDKVMVGGFQRLTSLDDARKRMDSMGVSAAEVDGLMDGLTDTLTGTAFSLDAGAGAMANFIAAGVDIDDVNDRLEMTADTAAFAQQPLDEIANIFTKIQTQGKLTAEELNMLQERGVPALVLLADAAGVTAEAMRDMISRGEVDAERFFQLWEQGAKGFGENNIKIEGAAQSMGDTISGSLANAGTALEKVGAEILERFVPAITTLAEVTTDAGNAFVSISDGLDTFNAKAEETIEKVAGQELDKGFFDETAWNTATLGLYGVVTSMRDVVFGTDEAKESTGLFNAEIDRVRGVIESYLPKAGELSDEMADVAAETEAAKDAFTAYQDALKIATSPVLGLIDAVNKVDEAQRSYNEAVATYGANSAEAQGAAVDLFEATVGLDSAAHNTELSFAGVNDVLAGMVSQGALTEAQAGLVADAIGNAQDAAEDYQGEYPAELLAEIDEPAIRDAEARLNTIARVRNPKFISELDRQAEIRARNRLNAVAKTRRAPVNAVAGNIRQVDGALDRLARNRSMTINVGYAVSGGLPAGIQRQHGGPVEADRPYIVGERGPEWFVPDRPGLVVSNKDAKSLMSSRTGGAMMGGGSVTNVYLTNQGVLGSQTEVERWLARSVNNLRRTGRLN